MGLCCCEGKKGFKVSGTYLKSRITLINVFDRQINAFIKRYTSEQTQPARFYGLPKMHKARQPNSTPPLRPIVSSIGTYNYNLSKFLCNLLEPHVPRDYNVRDTFSFVQEINQLSTSGKFMVSFDVESPQSLRSRVVYKFSCAGCNASYIGETTRHICARVREHLLSDKSSHVYRHLQSSRACHDSCTAECFTILDSAVSKFQIKIKEAMRIKWENPTLNQQLKHLELSLSF